MTTHFLPPGIRMPDSQQYEVYAWERDFVEKLVGPEMMSREECEDLVAAAAVHLRLPSVPSVSFPVIKEACRAYPSRNLIEIAEWGRGRVTVLHEMAHFGSWRNVIQGEEPHGESFVGCAIDLYARFLRIGIDELERTARLRRLRFVPSLKANMGRVSGDMMPDF